MSARTKPQTETTTSQAPTSTPATAAQVATIEQVEQRLALFLQDQEALRDRIERTMQEADEASRQADAVYREAGNLEARGEVDAAHAKLKAIKPLREKAQQLRASVGKFADEIAPLAERGLALRAEAHQLLLAAEAEIKAAEVRRNRVAGVFHGTNTHCLSQVRDLLAKWRKSMGLAEESQPAQPKPAKASKPHCPRCRNNQFVESIGLDRWRCHAGFHGVIDFNGQGTILPRKPAQESIAVA